MILTDYYRMERLPENDSKRTPRFDCVASTKSYPPFQAMAAKSRQKRFFCYYNGIPDSFSDRARNQAERAITNGKNISSVYVPNMNNIHKGFGDVRNTNDAIIFEFSEDWRTMELFIARGYKNGQAGLFQMYYSGELRSEVERLRNLVR